MILIIKYWRLFLELVLLVIIGLQFSHVKYLKNQLANEKLQSSTLATSLNNQNQAILDLKAAADNQLKASLANIARVKAESELSKAKANKIYQVQPTSTDDCTAAKALVQ